MQVFTRVVNKAKNATEAKKIKQENLNRNTELIDGVLGFRAGASKLFLFPEFHMAGYPMAESIKEWIEKGCCIIPGEETDIYAEKAKQYGIYIAGNMYEYDPEWPNRYFNCSWIIDPQGKVALKYRRINSAMTPSPHDFLDEYIKKYGITGNLPISLFPVLKTRELGNLAIFPCGEVMYPEFARVFMMAGAEVLLHPTGDSGATTANGHGMSYGWACCQVARATENMMYFVSANHAGMLYSPQPVGIYGGGSQIIDFQGNVVAASIVGGQEHSISATINIDLLRETRKTTGAGNWLARARQEVFKWFYDNISIYPPNAFSKEPMEHPKQVMEVMKRSIENMRKLGIIVEEPSQK
jgi:predicted amidohydrolase